MEDLFEKVNIKKNKAPVFEAYIDGASSGNPGPSAVGVVIYKDKKQVSSLAKFIGRATNNVAEYTALIYALEHMLKINAKNVLVYTDSQLLANQVTKKFKVKNEALKELNFKVLGLFSYFDKIEIKNIAREKNSAADKLAEKAIKEQAKVTARQITLAGGKSGLQREA